MRRVVVTGMGMVTPLGCGVETTWARLLKGESGAKKIETFDVSDISCKIAGVVPRGDGSDGTFNPDQWMEPKEQRKVDDFIIFGMCAARQALDDAGWRPQSSEEQNSHRRADRLRHRRRRRHRRHRHHPARERPAPDFAVLHSRPHHQSRLRLRFDRIRPQGPQPRRGHRLLDRRARHRRRRAHDRARRCRRDGGGRHRSRRSTASRLRALRPCARCRPVSTTTPEARLASLRQGPRRLRDGRGRRRGGAGRARPCQGARRQDLCRAHRLRAVGRCLSYHRTVAGRRRRRSAA